MSASHARAGTPVNTPRQVLFASLVGTTIEFFDFYIYATAAVLVFPRLFFPSGDPATATLASLATFGIAFLARPIGSVLFGHFGDRIGRKTTLVVALATMGISTVAIGVLPGSVRSFNPSHFFDGCQPDESREAINHNQDMLVLSSHIDGPNWIGVKTSIGW